MICLSWWMVLLCDSKLTGLLNNQPHSMFMSNWLQCGQIMKGQWVKGWLGGLSCNSNYCLLWWQAYIKNTTHWNMLEFKDLKDKLIFTLLSVFSGKLFLFWLQSYNGMHSLCKTSCPPRAIHWANPCSGLQGFPVALIPWVLPCCINRSLGESTMHYVIIYHFPLLANYISGL